MAYPLKIIDKTSKLFSLSKMFVKAMNTAFHSMIHHKLKTSSAKTNKRT